ncbi:MAG: Peptide deformylase [Candidatus Nomurabacteria bacterium GW2011_GWE1_32_28]|uniref:Peptide deformylase n=1 Tax=Candidatus Nomurabacteria bacterium GW2011_GWF1_31_48 TaxID=1618767 RepID=A0A0F9YFK5_9BACT|nr:MAG: Peptide deformylase [Candidatus Nomurabacteria bacterium GW2011_GWF2_30_133]KKP29081.1 MAG: Peptide deformylase [Candidatus Nomurabacteria bacterium GW2011_GWE2_31_40]KKP30509.1 MAG: Peptide deformylase [Candidatus Nomurabacteria bacterium GW2011_GWF1_31_48]KKP34994.1 MAG: Peptide deformylase [Candidatus Nomurabacteria bacterium GW2011_GWE1_32_28]HAS80638.1 peptide deformylase [Candidatus Nomurabacteria bacterium]
MVKIIQNGNKTLRKIAKEVSISEIIKPKIQKILKDMSEALDGQNDGVAIAAPQINVSLRIFIVSGKIFDENFINDKNIDKDNFSNKKISPNLIFINPILKKISREKKLLEEGCLSVRPIFGKVRRSVKAVVEAYDENGKKFTRGGSGLLAHIFQHEIDHLEGVLFIDKAEEMREILE